MHLTPTVIAMELGRTAKFSFVYFAEIRCSETPDL